MTHTRLQTLLACATVALILVLTLLAHKSQANQQVAFEPGGSNYVMLTLGDYLQDPELWGDEERGVKALVSNYHLNPEHVRNTLIDMRASGQEKIALVLWYTTWDTSTNMCRYVHTIVLGDDGACIEIFQNLDALLRDIKDAGFNEVVIRFAPQGNSDHLEWTRWESERFEKAWQFIAETRDVVEASLFGSEVKRVYDLCLECGGFKKGQAERFMKETWTRYVTSYGNSDSVLASIIYSKEFMNNFLNMINSLRSQVPNEIKEKLDPSEYAFDIYSATKVKDRLKEAQSILKKANKKQPLVLTETFYDDCNIAKQIEEARKSGVNLRTVYQWPFSVQTHAAGGSHFTTADPVKFQNYSQIGQGVRCSGAGGGGGIGPNNPYRFEQMK